MKRFNYRAISLIPGLVKLIERDRPRSSERRHVLRMQFREAPVPGHARTTTPPSPTGLQSWRWDPGLQDPESPQDTGTKGTDSELNGPPINRLDQGHSSRVLGPQCRSDLPKVCGTEATESRARKWEKGMPTSA